jgi:hypothetical protein
MNKIEKLNYIAAIATVTVFGISSIVRIGTLHRAALHRNNEFVKTIKEEHEAFEVELAEMKSRKDNESN